MSFEKREINQLVNEEFEKYEMLRFNDIYANYFKTEAIKNNTILMEVRDGQTFVGNVRALYLKMIQDADLQEMTYYVVYDNEEHLASIKKFTAFNTKTHFVERHSDEYAKCLASCQYVVTNSTFISAYLKKEGQVYINTWHGTALKHLGFDLPQITANKNVLRNFLMTDYIISPNAHMTNVFLNSYRLDGLYEGKILEGGYPRIDSTFHPTDIKDYLVKQGIELSGKPIVLYTPTYRGANTAQPEFIPEQLLSETQYLIDQLPEYQILVKVHPFIFDRAKEIEGLQSYLIDDGIDANELLSLTDLLITDYSSIFFDYLVTDKPIIFYCEDQEEYKRTRGMYFESDELPGPVVSTIKETVALIQNQDWIDQYKDLCQAMKEKIVCYDNGEVAQQYINHIFKHKPEIKEVSANLTKKKLLFYAGGMQNNGITQALLGLVNHIDLDKYDISVLLNDQFDKTARNNILKLPDHVRKIFRVGWPIFTKEERIADKMILNYPKASLLKRHRYEDFYTRESNRVLSSCQFDVAIDYSAYSSYWTKYIAFSKAPLKMAYLHNDMVSEIKVKPDLHQNNLISMFLFYRYYNDLVNVSQGLNVVNRYKLAAVADESQMTAAHNLLNLGRLEDSEEASTDVSKELNSSKFVKLCEFTGKLAIFKDPFNAHYDELEVTATDSLLITQKMTTYNGVFYKLLINYCYVGWVNQELPLKVAQPVIEEIDAYGIIKRTYRQLITLDIPGATEEVRRATGAGRLKNVMVHLTQAINMPDGSSYFKVDVGTLNGYVKASVIEVIEEATEQTMIEHNDEFEDAITNVPTFSGANNQYYEIINNEAKIYTGLKGLPETKEKPWSVQRILDQPLYSPWQMTNQNGTYVQFKTPNRYSGWINLQDVKEMTLNEVIKEPINLLGKMQGTDIPLYASVDDVVNQHPCHYLPHFDGHVMLKQMVWTDRGPVIEIVLNDDHYCVDESYIKERIQPNAWKTIDGKLAPLPKEFDLSFITMGRLSPEKNQKALIQAMPAIQKQYPDKKIGLYILGEGSLEEELQAEIKRLKLNKNVFLLGQKEKPFEYLKECQVFIFPSIHEGQGLAAMEAITLGLPVIATDTDVMQQVLANGKYGTFIDGTDAEAISKAVISFITDKPDLQKFDAVRYNQEAMDEFYQLINKKPTPIKFKPSWKARRQTKKAYQES